MKIFAVGDLHLSFDVRVRKPMDVFGPEWANHADRLKENWERAVGPEDLVLIPGDISWGLKPDEAEADLKWIEALPGRKILTKGNHDLWWMTAGKLNGRFRDMFFLQNTSVLVRPDGSLTPGREGQQKANAYPAPEERLEDCWFICGTRGWTCPGSDGFEAHDEKIYRREVMRLRFSLEDARVRGAAPGRIIAMLHYPPTNEKLQRSDFTDLLREYEAGLCVYGHLHGKENFRRGMQGHFNDVDYRLVSLDSLACEPALLCTVGEE